MTTLFERGEESLIDRIASRVAAHPDCVTGIGDDAAVVRGGTEGYDMLLTSDPVIEGIHFTADAAPERIGHKAAGRVLSDVAAMGGEPRWLLINAAGPRDMDADRMEAACRAAAETAEAFGAAVVGGDVAESAVFALHVFCVGRVEKDGAWLRSSAAPGQALFVTGALGGSRTGRHLDFTPRLREARWLRAHAPVMAAMDVSDGLAADLPRMLLSSDCAAEVRVDKLPLAEGLRETDRLRALTDGEDYELLFTVPGETDPAWTADFQRTFGIPCTRIGSVREGEPGLCRWLDNSGKAMDSAGGGYLHFSRG